MAKLSKKQKEKMFDGIVDGYNDGQYTGEQVLDKVERYGLWDWLDKSMQLCDFVDEETDNVVKGVVLNNVFPNG